MLLRVARCRTESLASSNRVSEFVVWKLKFCEQRLAPKITQSLRDSRKLRSEHRPCARVENIAAMLAELLGQNNVRFCHGQNRWPWCASYRDDGDGEIVRCLASTRKVTALSTLIRQRHLTPSCGGHALPRREQWARQGSRGQLVATPGIREQHGV